MKKFLLATTVAIAALSTGFAVSAQDLSESIRFQVTQLVPDANLDNLSDTQVAELNGLFSNSDNLSSGANPAGVVKQILDGSSARMVSQFQLTEGQKAEIRLNAPGITEAQMENLSTAQMARLTALWNADSTMQVGEATEATLKEILMADMGVQISSIGLNDGEKSTVLGLVPEAQLDVLTVAQVSELTTLLADSSLMTAEANPQDRIRIILGL